MSRGLKRYNTNSSCCGRPEKPPKDFVTNHFDDESESEAEEHFIATAPAPEELSESEVDHVNPQPMALTVGVVEDPLLSSKVVVDEEVEPVVDAAAGAPEAAAVAADAALDTLIISELRADAALDAARPLSQGTAETEAAVDAVAAVQAEAAKEITAAKAEAALAIAAVQAEAAQAVLSVQAEAARAVAAVQAEMARTAAEAEAEAEAELAKQNAEDDLIKSLTWWSNSRSKDAGPGVERKTETNMVQLIGKANDTDDLLKTTVRSLPTLAQTRENLVAGKVEKNANCYGEPENPPTTKKKMDATDSKVSSTLDEDSRVDRSIADERNNQEAGTEGTGTQRGGTLGGKKADGTERSHGGKEETGAQYGGSVGRRGSTKKENGATKKGNRATEKENEAQGRRHSLDNIKDGESLAQMVTGGKGACRAGPDGTYRHGNDAGNLGSGKWRHCTSAGVALQCSKNNGSLSTLDQTCENLVAGEVEKSASCMGGPENAPTTKKKTDATNSEVSSTSDEDSRVHRSIADERNDQEAGKEGTGIQRGGMLAGKEADGTERSHGGKEETGAEYGKSVGRRGSTKKENGATKKGNRATEKENEDIIKDGESLAQMVTGGKGACRAGPDGTCRSGSGAGNLGSLGGQFGVEDGAGLPGEKENLSGSGREDRRESTGHRAQDGAASRGGGVGPDSGVEGDKILAPAMNAGGITESEDHDLERRSAASVDAWEPGGGRRWPTSICYPPTNYEWWNSFYHEGRMFNKTYLLSALETWSYYAFDSEYWKDFHYDSPITPTYDRLENSLRMPREVMTSSVLLLTAFVVALLGDDGGGEEIVFILALTYPIYATIRCLAASEINHDEMMHWIGYWMAYYLLCIEPATFDFLTYWWMPFRQVFKGLIMLWLVIPRESRPPPSQRPLPSPSLAVAEGLRAAEEVRQKWVTKIVEDGKEHYAKIMASQGYGSGGDPLKPGIKGWDTLAYAFLMSCFYLYLESYH